MNNQFGSEGPFKGDLAEGSRQGAKLLRAHEVPTPPGPGILQGRAAGQGTPREAKNESNLIFINGRGHQGRPDGEKAWARGGPSPGIPRVLGVPERMASLARQKEKWVHVGG